jgi:hypothetical protein
MKTLIIVEKSMKNDQEVLQHYIKVTSHYYIQYGDKMLAFLHLSK